MEKEANMKEEDRIREIIKSMAKGDDIGHKLAYDQRTKTIRPVSIYQDPDQSPEITPEDASLAAINGGD
jgi:hypothetical protein